MKRGAWLGALVGVMTWCAAPAIADAKPLPNLKLTKIGNPPVSGAPGDTSSVAFTEKNTGKRRAKPSVTRFYASIDRKLGNDDARVASSAIPKLKPGKAINKHATVKLPVSLADGSYYLVGCADDKHAVKESKEGDNCRASKASTMVQTPTVSATPYQINNGEIAEGTAVTVDSLVVTATAPGGSLWAQTSTGLPENSALEITLQGVPPDLQPGDVVNLTGTAHTPGLGQPGLTQATADVVGSSAPPAPYVLSNAQISQNATAFNALLVTAENQTLVSQAGGDWAMASGLTVRAGVISSLPSFANGSVFNSITGVARTFTPSFEMFPRSSGDIVAPPQLSSFGVMNGHHCVYGVGDPNVPIAQVTLSAPAQGDTFIAVSSGNPSVVTINGLGVTIPNGQTSATVFGNKVDAGSATLSASEGSINLSDFLTIRGPGDAVALADLALAADTVSAGQDVVATVTLDCEAPSGTTVTLSVNPPSTASVPPSVTVPAGQNSATFNVHGDLPGQATISATLGATTKTANVTVN